MGGEYRRRIIDSVIDRFINDGKKVTVFGPSMCGLSTTMRRLDSRVARVSDDMASNPDLIMHTMSLFESGESDGSISISGLFSGQSYDGIDSPTDEKVIIKSMARGGWPSAVFSGRNGAKDARKFLEDIGDLTLLKPIANQVDTTTSFSQVIRNMDRPISRLTADNRLKALKSSMVVENIPSWELGVRPGDRLIMADKWFLTDPSLVTVLLGLTPSQLRNRHEELSKVFTNLCIRDLRVYLTPLGGRMFHYFTRTRFDGGFIIETDDGRWAAFKTCVDPSEIEDLAHDLNIITQAESDRGSPVFSMIITMGGTSYTRDDGIKVVPIACLRD